MTRHLRTATLALALAFAVPTASGCFLFQDEDTQLLPDLNFDGVGGDGQLFDPAAGKGIGLSCTKEGEFSDCRFGLKCVDGACRAVGDTPSNYPCILNAECAAGLYCSIAGVCAPSGDGQQNDACGTGSDCADGLYCHSLGMAGYCNQPGPGDIGASCASPAECMGGLLCGATGKCEAGNIVFGLKPWPGVGPTVCSATPDEGPARVYFEIPRDDVVEFFRLPFPNDIRLRGGTVKLDGFPQPGPGVIGFDPVERIKDAVEAQQTGFSTMPSVLFRFSKGVQFGSIVATGESPTLRFVNIDPDSSGYSAGLSYSWFVTDGGGKYICPRWLSVTPAWAGPLEPGTTYAVILTEGVKTHDNELLKADNDLTLMLSDARPGGSTEAAAWDSYAPLRAFLDDQAIGRGSVIGATVFTTQDTQGLLAKTRAAVQAFPAAAPKDLTLCDGATASPCDDGLSGEDHTRGCFEVSNEVYELHMKVPVPMVQRGTRPYLEPTDGGEVALTPQGAPDLAQTEDVCVSLTIPKNVPMPAGGWPLVISGHGTGGTFRSSVGGVGIPLADVVVAGTRVGAAVVGWDGPMHGDRRNSEFSPEILFYNFANPRAAFGNLVQGAADVFALVKTLQGYTVAAADSPTGAEIRFDATKIAHIGHSQGATTGPLASPYEPDIDANVWSGAGAGLVQSLLNKKEPVDARAGVAVALQELNDQGVTVIDDKHPVLRLIQGFFDPVDPLNHGILAHQRPLEAVGPQHVLQFYGVGDSFTPPPTIETFAKVLRLDQMQPPVVSFGMPEVPAPITANRKGDTITAGLVVHQPSGYDGHFVMFRNPSAVTQLEQFIGTWIVDGVPSIVAP